MRYFCAAPSFCAFQGATRQICAKRVGLRRAGLGARRRRDGSGFRGWLAPSSVLLLGPLGFDPRARRARLPVGIARELQLGHAAHARHRVAVAPVDDLRATTRNDGRARVIPMFVRAHAICGARASGATRQRGGGGAPTERARRTRGDAPPPPPPRAPSSSPAHAPSREEEGSERRKEEGLERPFRGRSLDATPTLLSGDSPPPGCRERRGDAAPTDMTRPDLLAARPAHARARADRGVRRGTLRVRVAHHLPLALAAVWSEDVPRSNRARGVDERRRAAAGARWGRRGAGRGRETEVRR